MILRRRIIFTVEITESGEKEMEIEREREFICTARSVDGRMEEERREVDEQVNG